MGLFSMPGGGSDVSDADDDSSTTDATSGDGSLSSLFNLQDVGSGYGVTTYTDPPTPTTVASDLGSLQSGSTTTSTLDLNAAFADTLGTIVALDSINSAANTTGIGYYTAANGQTYEIGTGPGAAAAGSSAGGLGFWLVIGLVAWLLIEKEGV
jgi:hypothetical protein